MISKNKAVTEFKKSWRIIQRKQNNAEKRIIQRAALTLWQLAGERRPRTLNDRKKA